MFIFIVIFYGCGVVFRLNHGSGPDHFSWIRNTVVYLILLFSSLLSLQGFSWALSCPRGSGLVDLNPTKPWFHCMKTRMYPCTWCVRGCFAINAYKCILRSKYSVIAVTFWQDYSFSVLFYIFFLIFVRWLFLLISDYPRAVPFMHGPICPNFMRLSWKLADCENFIF